jgi:hypothetical protein
MAGRLAVGAIGVARVNTRRGRFIALIGPGGRLEVVYRITAADDLIDASHIESLAVRSVLGGSRG